MKKIQVTLEPKYHTIEEGKYYTLLYSDFSLLYEVWLMDIDRNRVMRETRCVYRDEAIIELHLADGLMDLLMEEQR